MNPGVKVRCLKPLGDSPILCNIIAKHITGIEPASPAWKAGIIAIRPYMHETSRPGVEPGYRQSGCRFSRPVLYQLSQRDIKTGAKGVEPISTGSKPATLAVVLYPYKMTPAGIEPSILCLKGTSRNL